MYGKPEDTAPLTDRLGYSLSEFIDDAAPMNQRRYVMGAEHVVKKFGLAEQTLLTTAEELAALPRYSVVIDRDNDVWQLRADDHWVSYETAPSKTQRLAKYGPLRVIFRAEADRG